jgi:hydroxymethylpyrimidine/phosphomethylpyrimidine kinase
MRFNQASVPVTDYAASRNFYQELGLKLIVDSPDKPYARFETPGGATLSLHGDNHALYFECDDLDARVAALQSVGFLFDSEPVDQLWGWREAWLVDPAGNRLCLYSGGENRRYPPWRVGQ